MAFSTPGTVLGGLLGTAVLLVAMLLVARTSGAPRLLTGLAWGFFLQMMRSPIGLAGPIVGDVASLIVGESVHMAGSAVVAAAVMRELGRPTRPLVMVAAWVGLTLWVAVAAMVLPGVAPHLPAALLAGAVFLAAALAFWRRADASPGVGYRWVAVLFALSGAFQLVSPWLAQDPLGFILTQGLVTGLAVALIIAADRDRGQRLATERQRNQRLLELQGTAIAAAANAIFITSRSGRIEWANEAFGRLSGFPADLVLGRSARRLLAGKEGGAQMRRLFETLAAGRPWRGELELRRRDGTLYVVDQTVTPILGEEGGVAHFVVVQEDITERRHAEERIRFLSDYDALTALPNRLRFREHLQDAVERARVERRAAAVLMLDLDDLSKLNDSLGHEAADRFLVVTVERLKAAARGNEVVARAGGDEFAILMEGASADAAAELAQLLGLAVSRPVDIDGHEVQIGCSVGIALFPGDGGEAETLIKNAEIAMYRATREAPGGYRFFAPGMDEELAARRRLESGLRRALAHGELELHYQPQVSVATGRIVGFEALLRWNHPTEGLLLPTTFIPLAEETGLIAPIGDWVLRQACRQAREWAEAGLPAVPMAVNMSVVQLRDKDLALQVRRALQEARLAPSRLELELTESAVMHDADVAQQVLGELRALGVRLAIDDFGTGYSSLGRLKRFPVDKLKIDRSFVDNLPNDEGDAAIARAIVHLGHSLGLEVVSEGVETEAQLAYLRDEGCDTIQGFLYSPAVPARAAAGLLKRGGF